MCRELLSNTLTPCGSEEDNATRHCIQSSTHKVQVPVIKMTKKTER